MNTNPPQPSPTTRSIRSHLCRLALLALLSGLAVLFLVWLGWSILPWLALPPVVEPYIRELGRVASWPRELIAAVTILVVVVTVFCFRALFTSNPRRRRLALAGGIALALAYCGLHFWHSRNHLFNATGEPMFYWGLTPAGTIHKQSRPGTNPYTHNPLKPASREYLALIHSRLREPLHPVDPALHDWFDPNTGWPLLWCFRSPQGPLEFYTRPAIHPRYQVELQEVTVELRHQWERDQARLQAGAAAREQQERAAEAARLQREQQAHQAEQERLLKIEQARLEAQRLEEQAARHGLEVAALRAREEQARRDTQEREAQRRQAAAAEAARALQLAETAAREQAALARREREQREAAAAQQRQAEARRHQAILDRRAREATAGPGGLDWFHPAEMIRQTCPQLSADSFRAETFADDFQLRRFRFKGLVTQFRKTSREAVLAPVTCGQVHCVVIATLSPAAVAVLRVNRELDFTATVVAIQFATDVTDLNGLSGRICTVKVANALPTYDRRNVAQTALPPVTISGWPRAPQTRPAAPDRNL